MKKEHFIQIFLSILVSIGIVYIFFNADTNKFEYTKVKVEKEIANIYANFDKTTKTKDLKQNKITIDEFNALNRNLPFDLYIYENNNLIFWNDNKAIPENIANLVDKNVKLVSLKNGYYLALKKTIGNKTFIALSLLRNSYSLVNKYLTNSFSEQFPFEDKDVIMPPEHTHGEAIHAPNGEVLFKILKSESKSNVIDETKNIISIIVYALMYFFFFQIISYINAKKNKNLFSVFLSFIFGIFWFWCLNLIPFEFKKNILFSPLLYGSIYFRSLGHLLIFSITTLTFSYQVLYLILNNRLKFNVFFKIILIALAIGNFVYFTLIMKSVILDSIINYGAKNLALLNIFSILGLSIILLLFANFVFLIIAISYLIKKEKEAYYTIIISSVLIFSLLLYYKFGILSLLLTSTLILYLLVILYYKIIIKKNSATFLLLISLLFIVIHVSFEVNFYNAKKIENNKKVLAFKQTRQSDIRAEDSFDKIEEKIRNDSYVKNFFEDPMSSYKNLYNRLIIKYFGGYYSKFNISILPFNFDGKPIKNLSTTTLEDYYSLLNKFGKETLAKELYFIQKNEATYSYLALLQIEDKNKTLGILGIKITSKSYDIGNVYPELLLEGKSEIINQYENEYEYAIYDGNILKTHNKSFPYPSKKEDFLINNEHLDNYVHKIFDVGNNKTVIISSKKVLFLDKISIFSFILSLYFILGFLIFLAYFITTKEQNNEVFNFSFRKKISISMLSLVALSFLIISIATIGYFSKQYNEYHKKRLIRKQKSIVRSMNYVINENNIENEFELKRLFISTLNKDIIELSDIHKMDINIFDLKGNLLTSSQDGIFTSGLLSNVMNPYAYIMLHNENKVQVVQDEKIGYLNYLAIYVPIRNSDNKIISYINIPYFSKEKNLKQDISNFMISLTNVYILLFIIGSIIAFFVSNSITKPLQDISNKLRNISLKKKNEHIEWNSKDEIGALVTEYNKMIVQLKNSADLLAKTERDEAWREMAKQIAHEIKNPLTPMKLSIQHLQRAIKDDPFKAVDLSNRVSRTLIEQIDNLTDIATAFSSFAKMPKAQKEEVNLEEILNVSIDLFNEQKKIITKKYSENNALVYADKNQLISVFNNLIKNAIQATNDIENAKIEVRLFKEKNWFYIEVEDNGTGISEEKKPKVFVPNFTTKSSGTGLGLAISKQVIENLNGNIWFESKANEYTIFYVKIPKLIKV